MIRDKSIFLIPLTGAFGKFGLVRFRGSYQNTDVLLGARSAHFEGFLHGEPSEWRLTD